MPYRAEGLGLLTIPICPSNLPSQIWFLKNFQIEIIHILPSYALKLNYVCQEMGIYPYKDFNLKLAVIGAEPYTESVRP